MLDELFNWVWTIALTPFVAFYQWVHGIKTDVEINKVEITNIKESINGLDESIEKTCVTIQKLNENLSKLDGIVEIISKKFLYSSSKK